MNKEQTAEYVRKYHEFFALTDEIEKKYPKDVENRYAKIWSEKFQLGLEYGVFQIDALAKMGIK